jgi:hypothetical protein
LERGKPGAVRILNRIVTVTENGLEYEADQRHAEILMRDMGIDESCKGVVTPGVSTTEGGANWRSASWRKKFVPSSSGPRELLRAGPDGHAVRRQGDQ